MKKPVGLAVVGGRRGRAFNSSLAALADKVRLVAVCDVDERVLAAWKTEFPQIAVYTEYARLLDDPAVDAVFLATPIQLHAAQSIQALRAGKHVLAEVVAATSLEECWELVETVEETGLTYMMAENCCYMRPNLMVLNMVEHGLFGEIVHAEGAYIHDVRNLMVRPDGSLTWRGELARDWNRSYYPTHSLGPVAQWLGINRSDRFAQMVTMISQPSAMHRYFRDMFGAGHPGASRDYWRLGDSQVSVIRTEKGALIVLRVDVASPRPANGTHYALQGSRGAYLSGRYPGEDPLVWLDGLSPGFSPPRDGQAAQWEPLWNYAAQYEHPLWRAGMEAAASAGHGGADFFVLQEFAEAVLEGRPPAIDVYDAVTWSCVNPLSDLTVLRQGEVVEIPDFRPQARGRAKESAQAQKG